MLHKQLLIPIPICYTQATSIPTITKKVVPILKNPGVVKAAFFGSFARGEATSKSDVDLLVKFKGEKTLFDLAHLKLTLEEKTGKKIDILTYDSIHPSLRKIILGDQKIFYEKDPRIFLEHKVWKFEKIITIPDTSPSSISHQNPAKSRIEVRK